VERKPIDKNEQIKISVNIKKEHHQFPETISGKVPVMHSTSQEIFNIKNQECRKSQGRTWRVESLKISELKIGMLKGAGLMKEAGLKIEAVGFRTKAELKKKVGLMNTKIELSANRADSTFQSRRSNT
jgi:hypothetical protein